MKSNLFIFEGPDCCGKTTLAKAFACKVGAVYFHCTASKRMFAGLMDYHSNVLMNAQENILLGRPVVLDRFWPSERVYGGIFRPNSGYIWQNVREWTKQHEGKYIFCASDKGWERYAQGHVDPAHSLNEEQYKRVTHAYREAYLEQLAFNPSSARQYTIEQNGGIYALSDFLTALTTF